MFIQVINYANTCGGLIEDNKIPVEPKMKNKKNYCEKNYNKKILIKNSYKKIVIKRNCYV